MIVKYNVTYLPAFLLTSMQRQVEALQAHAAEVGRQRAAQEVRISVEQVRGCLCTYLLYTVTAHRSSRPSTAPHVALPLNCWSGVCVRAAGPAPC